MGANKDPAKQAALERGDIKYHGSNCRVCDSTLRYTKSSCCVKCQQTRHRPKVYENGGRARAFKRNYGISIDEYDKLFESQNGVCKICNKSCATGRRLSVDHDHTTGKVRGLLCRNCNVALGYLQDDPLLLERCVLYLDGRL